ncbi:BTAD domain-containing putative transcriptional regulator [Actinomadura sp. 3N508]|uniref:AfsR/SARP family transcriptional regulator n=1 Tax=Actinomadura sp. 3N508 TaxID=3375153 RepID=UPI0037BDFACA
MKYELLGPLRLVNENGTSSISAIKIETLLRVLLIRSGQVVTTGQLITEIWREDMPRRAIAGLHVYVSKLRKFVRGSDSAIVTHPAGYQLRTGSDQIDAHTFREHIRQGRGHARDRRPEAAAESFNAALSLVRGPIGHSFHNGPIVQGFATWAEEAQLECTEMLLDAKLALGLHREVISDLYSLMSAHPFREVFYQQLMLALYRSDQQASALEVYRTARHVLANELGIEPCHTLQGLYQAILKGDRRLEERTRHTADTRRPEPRGPALTAPPHTSRRALGRGSEIPGHSPMKGPLAALPRAHSMP